MRLLKGILLGSMLFVLVSCSEEPEHPEFYEDAGLFIEEEPIFEFPNAVKVLAVNAVDAVIPRTEILETDYMLETLEMTLHFPGTHIVSRSFTEQLINTLLSLGHTITIDYVTDIFIYLHMEYSCKIVENGA